MALVGASIAEARSIMVEGVSGLVAVARNRRKRLQWEPSLGRLRWPNGSEARLFSGDHADGLRGPEHDFAWCDELAKWREAEEAWVNVQFGLKARVGNSGLHKRMMFLATAIPLPAAISRITWLPNSFPASPVGNDLWVLFALSPLFLWAAMRNRRVHEAYWVWVAFYAPTAILVAKLWDTPWWHATARQIMGV